jgi:signal transduction histidine kinase
VELLGGSIAVENQLEEGAKITLRISVWQG